MFPMGYPDISQRYFRIASSGARVRLLECGPPSGTPVLLVHGWGASVYTYRDLFHSLASAGRRVIAAELPGHGLSTPGEQARRQYIMETLLSYLRDIIGNLSSNPIDLVAHSLGGALALRLAWQSPQLIHRLVLAAPVGLRPIRLRTAARLLTPRFTTALARFMVPRWIISMLVHGAYGEPHLVSEEAVEQYWAPSQFPTYYRALRALLADFDWSPLSSAELGAIRHPALVILGSADRLIPDATGAAACLPNARVITIQGGGHLALEEHALEVNQTIARFLAADGSM